MPITATGAVDQQDAAASKALRAVECAAVAGWTEHLMATGERLAAEAPQGWTVRWHAAGVDAVTYFPGGVELLTLARDARQEGVTLLSPRAGMRGAVPSDVVFVIPYFADHWEMRCVPERFNKVLAAGVGSSAPHFIGTAAQLFRLLDALELSLRSLLGKDYPPWRTSFCWKDAMCKTMAKGQAPTLQSKTLGKHLLTGGAPAEDDDDEHAVLGPNLSESSLDSVASSSQSASALSVLTSAAVSPCSPAGGGGAPRQHPMYQHLLGARVGVGFTSSHFTDVACYPASPPK